MQNTIQQEERPALSSLMTSDYGSTWLIRINDLGTRMVFFAFDVAPHHRLASPDQFRYGRHHLAKSHERTQSPLGKAARTYVMSTICRSERGVPEQKKISPKVQMSHQTYVPPSKKSKKPKEKRADNVISTRKARTVSTPNEQKKSRKNTRATLRMKHLGKTCPAQVLLSSGQPQTIKSPMMILVVMEKTTGKSLLDGIFPSSRG
ncbi:hypothetical protein SeMB42_g01014 [Synchytrium endobioticum]|uniref:Uncharacterized protein n=1 Tax=Synchytrium endobioticum TaxID=286115 RepID=A0A507DN12_9FUNG|nr:hypothetical protein SeMB42_g01014 [Synchytrium endobioticum]